MAEEEQPVCKKMFDEVEWNTKEQAAEFLKLQIMSRFVQEKSHSMGHLFQQRSYSIDRSWKLSRRHSYPMSREERASILEVKELQLFMGAAGIEQECYQESPLNEPEIDETSRAVDDDGANTESYTTYQQNTTKGKKNSFTSLMIASHKGHYEIVKILLQNKEKPDVSVIHESSGWSALMWACSKKGSKEYTQKQLMENHFNIAKELVAAGADVNQKAKNGWTPLMQASKDGQVELVKFLCAQKGININHQSESSWSALTIACTYGQEDIAKILVDTGADATMKKNGGVTALHIACFKGLIDTVKHMVAPCKTRQQHRININIVDDWGMTPLTLAMKAKCKEVVKYLVEEARADVNIQAEKYLMWSAIFFALLNKDLNSYRLLRDNSANTELKDKIGNSLEAIGFGITFSDPFYKQFEEELIEEKKKYLGMEGKLSLPSPLSVNDKLKYFVKEIGWRSKQRPHLISAK